MVKFNIWVYKMLSSCCKTLFMIFEHNILNYVSFVKYGWKFLIHIFTSNLVLILHSPDFACSSVIEIKFHPINRMCLFGQWNWTVPVPFVEPGLFPSSRCPRDISSSSVLLIVQHIRCPSVRLHRVNSNFVDAKPMSKISNFVYF